MRNGLSIRFGTSGWRGVIADEFTFANLRRVAQAIVKYLQAHHLKDKAIIIGYDTRFLSKEFAQACAQSIAGSKIKVLLTDRDTPTPVISFQILQRQACGGINITASHNPPEYNGIKFSPAYGGPAPIEVTREIENNIKCKTLPGSGSKQAGGKLRLFDPRSAYLQRIKQLINFSVIRRAGLKLGVDVLYGTGRGYLDQLLVNAGCKVTVLHQRLDPLFGGLPPEPAPAQLQELIKLVKTKHLHLGLAVDGDADRFGIIDRDGSYINANHIIALLTDHLISTRPGPRKIVRTVATTHMLDALAQRAGLEVMETPVGFKYIGQQIAKGDCLIGGEESGGLSIAGHIPEKDGILACLLIAELAASRKSSLGALLRELYKEIGPFFSARKDLHLAQKDKLDFVHRIKLLAGRKSILGRKIMRFIGLDGYKFVFADGSWIMFRASGTEPVVRCYAEAKSKSKLKDLLGQGQNLIKRS